MNNILPYIPDTDRMVATARELMSVEIARKGEWKENPYAMFLFEHAAAGGDTFQLQSQYMDMLSEKKTESRHGLWELLRHQTICTDVLDAIGMGASGNDVEEKLKNRYTLQDVHVVMAWLERLRIVKYADGVYKPNDDEEEYEEEVKTGLYPLNMLDKVDIKEDKFSVFEYLRKVNGKKIIMNPDFQRNEVWKPEQKSQFIESAILNIPVPPFYFKSDLQGRLIVVDGLQRTSALREFMSNKLTLTGLNALSELNGENYDSLKADPEKAKLITRVEDKMLNFYELSAKTPMSVVYDIFNRINTGGTKLERQEIRNCIFIGHSTKLLKELSKDKRYRDAIGWGISDLRMKDREAALRCIAFTLLSTDIYKGSMDDFLEQAMRTINKMSEVEVEDLKSKFLKTMDETLRLFGVHNFRIPTGYTRGRVSIAVMETIYYAIYKLLEAGKRLNEVEMNRRFERLLNDNDYLDAVRNATGSMMKVTTRFEIVKKGFEII